MVCASTSWKALDAPGDVEADRLVAQRQARVEGVLPRPRGEHGVLGRLELLEAHDVDAVVAQRRRSPCSSGPTRRGRRPACCRPAPVWEAPSTLNDATWSSTGAVRRASCSDTRWASLRCAARKRRTDSRELLVVALAGACSSPTTAALLSPVVTARCRNHRRSASPPPARGRLVGAHSWSRTGPRRRRSRPRWWPRPAARPARRPPRQRAPRRAAPRRVRRRGGRFLLIHGHLLEDGSQRSPRTGRRGWLGGPSLTGDQAPGTVSGSKTWNSCSVSCVDPGIGGRPSVRVTRLARSPTRSGCGPE